MIHELGTVGMVCPFPLIEAQKKMATLQSGDELKIDFDCTQATEAIPNWAAENGYPVTNYEQIDNASWTITVQKFNVIILIIKLILDSMATSATL